MGQGWRRVTELMRQTSVVARLPSYVPGVDTRFRPTSNARNTEMFREATEFAAHLRTLERDLLAMHNQVEENLANMRSILLSPLPRVYEEGQHGPVPSEEEARIIGQAVNVDRITEAGKEMRMRLDQEVIQPVKQWMVAYRTIQDRMKQLEALRLELDSRRRTVGELQTKFETQRTAGASRGTKKFKTDLEIEQTAHRMQHKDEKLQRTASQYREMEQTVYNSLFTLVKDTSVLRDYAAAALLIAKDCFQEAHASFHEDGGMTHLEYGSTNAVIPMMANQQQMNHNYGAVGDAAANAYGAGDAYGAADYGRRAPEAPKPAPAAGNIFRTLSEKVRFRKLDTDQPADALNSNHGGAGTSGGGHDSDGERGYDQIYGGNHNGGGGEYDPSVLQGRPAAYEGGGRGHFRAASFGTGEAPPANNRYASALPAGGGGGNPYSAYN